MANCKDGITDVCRNYDYFFRLLFWDFEREGWFRHTDRLFREAFPQAVHCIEVKPPFRPGSLDCDVVYDTQQLRNQLEPIVARIVPWVDGMTAAAQCMQGKLLSSMPSSPAKQRLEEYLRTMRRLHRALAVPRPGKMPPAPAAACGIYLRWIREFREWGAVLAMWENGACALLGSDCHSRKSADDGPGRILQVAPPPWPPWPDFDEDAPDEPPGRGEVY